MKNQFLDTSLFDRAVMFATMAHAGTERRCKGYPYIIHPLEAAAIVATMTADQDILAAAVLHDTIEDTTATVADLEREFGKRIAALVVAETDDKCAPDGTPLSWHERKQRDIDHLAAAPQEVKMVALGDKLSNMRAIARDYAVKGDALWLMFHAKDKATHAWRYRALRDALSSLEGTAAFSEFDQLVRQVFG